jgi:twinkle protein
MSRLDELAKKLEQAGIPDIDFEKFYRENEEDNQKIKRLIEYYDDIEDFIQNGHILTGDTMPFPKMHDLFRFREGEVTLWSGYNGHKKSMMLGYFALNFIRQQKTVCIASFEMKPLSTINRMVKQFAHTHDIGYDEYTDFLQFANANFFIFDKQGGMSAERLYGVIYYAAMNLGVKHFIVDSLMRVIPGEDDHNAQKDFIVKICEIAIKTKIHIHIVHHTKKGKETEPSGRYDAKGSGGISDNVHNSLVVWSNKEKIKEMPDVILKCDKQREGEWEGKLMLDFEPSTLMFTEKFKGE